MTETRKGHLPHISWIDLEKKGIFTECAILKTDGFGNIFFFEVNTLDAIDKQRLTRILTNRNSQNFELWDLMSQITLNNGVNALTYFHQLVKVISPDGVIYNPKSGVVGGKVNINDETTQSATPVNPVVNQQPTEEIAPAAEKTVKRATTKSTSTKKA